MNEESTSQPPGSPGKLRILVADDSTIHQVLAAGILEREGHEVTVVENGKQAVAFLDREPFDLVLMDVEMPEMDGITATRVIRAQEKLAGAHTPIVALTSYPDRRACLEAGMDAYLNKPFQPDALRVTLERLLGNMTA